MLRSVERMAPVEAFGHLNRATLGQQVATEGVHELLGRRR